MKDELESSASCRYMKTEDVVKLKLALGSDVAKALAEEGKQGVSLAARISYILATSTRKLVVSTLRSGMMLRVSLPLVEEVPEDATDALAFVTTEKDLSINLPTSLLNMYPHVASGGKKNNAVVRLTGKPGKRVLKVYIAEANYVELLQYV